MWFWSSHNGKVKYKAHTFIYKYNWSFHNTGLNCVGPLVVGRRAPSRAPSVGSCLTLGKELPKETCVHKARDFIGRGHPGGKQQDKGTQENCSATWLEVLSFMVMGLISRLSLASHSDSESFLVVHTLFSQDWCQQEGFWEVVGHVVSPFDLSWTLLVGGGFLVPCSLPGPPVVKQLMQMVTIVPGQGGRFQSVCFP